RLAAPVARRSPASRVTRPDPLPRGRGSVVGLKPGRAVIDLSRARGTMAVCEAPRHKGPHTGHPCGGRFTIARWRHEQAPGAHGRGGWHQERIGDARPRRLAGDHFFRSKRSRFITLVQAATKSLTNFVAPSAAP